MRNFSDVVTRAAQRLRRQADLVQSVKPAAATTLLFNLRDVANVELLEALHTDVSRFAKKGQSTVYVFRLSDSKRYVAIIGAFDSRPGSSSGSDKAWSYSRRNGPSSPDALYVGSSMSLPERISQHVGRVSGGAGTFSMRLNLWATSVDAQVELLLWRFEGLLDPLCLETIEQQMWDDYRPLLGKRSGR
ncbi:hypothetical protein J2X36_002731 [Methylobacterium sp. BE186]|uniref:hypothetical protein n=1 Tax=Methylobacterium sp. BE186 TaxID=2817715 RepID=UPI002866DA9C|nr:hypothetical protein [Methylobacterium sp. BE186]MDR7037976.1 hypothetical protein [Methylobacterium sp. BE186]